MDFETLQNWLSGLTRYREIARHPPGTIGSFMAKILLSPLFLPKESSKENFFLEIVLFQMY